MQETELFVASILREDRSVLDLLTADYTFLNERLADHYGVPKIYGSQFRRVTLTDPNRSGLLGQGSILTVTSYPNRTSVVQRGKWILENLLGTPPPPPPADVPELEAKKNGKALTMREQMEQHRANPIVRRLPRADGSDRLRARELRRRRQVARQRRRRDDRRERQAAGRHGVRRSGRPDRVAARRNTATISSAP